MEKIKPFKSINWNKMEDVMDKLTYEKLCQQFWLSTRMVISNDVSDWSKLSDKERDLFNKVFGGLTALDTLATRGSSPIWRTTSATTAPWMSTASR